MTGRIRIIVVDDSVVVRRVVSEVLSEDPELEVVGTASNGKLALAKLEQTPADVVTLDFEMPELDGLQTLAAIRKRSPRLPVIMFSTATRRGAAATIDALSLGASEYVTKPDGGGLASTRECIKADLIPKIKALCVRPATMPIPRPRFGGDAERATAIAIGVSTGGPPALQELIGALPTLPVPVFIVQHMPPLFTTMLAARLALASKRPVVEATSGMRVVAGHVYLAPGDHHLVVERGALRVNKDAPECSCRPSVDVLFRSVANAYGAGALGVVMTGMGSDGTRGSEAIRERGGAVLVQDRATSVVWGMPGAVVRAGAATAVLPLSALVGEIARRAGAG
jgi:two-component system chemotaxis response regulator CheB